MESDFELEVILTATTGKNCLVDFSKFYDLAWFVFNDPLISPMGLVALKDTLRDHLLQIHPQLAGITYNAQLETSFDAWLNSLRQEYGEILPVCQLGQQLSNQQGKSK